jgi:hypothetical protein
MTCKHPYDDCRCLRRMGNDFWFLPMGACLDDPPKAMLGVKHNNDKDDAYVSPDHER